MMFPDMGWAWTPESATGKVVSVVIEDIRIQGFMTTSKSMIPETFSSWKRVKVESHTYTFEIWVDANTRLGRATSHDKTPDLNLLLAHALEGSWT
jgi:hypothetical protein